MTENKKIKMTSESNIPQTKIWFQLVDSDGQIIGTDKVVLSSSADMTDFRDAMQEKWDKPGYLKDIPSGILKIYQNMTAFARKEKPLDTKTALNELDSETDVLVVVVPFPLSPKQPSFAYAGKWNELLMNYVCINY